MKQSQQSQRNKMGVVPVPRLLLSMGAPMMLSMIVQALYNVVDSLFVSHIPDTDLILNAGDKAVNALTLAFPIQMLIMAFCVGTGVGVNAALSRSLGMGDRKTASRIAGNAVFLSICYYLAALLFGIFGTRPYILSQTTDPVVAEFAVSYLSIVTICSFGSIWYMCFEKLLQATGRTTAAMIGQLVGALTNLILDPVLIFGWLGLPAMGVAGAAAATVIGQCASFVTVLTLHLKQNTEITNALSGLRPDGAIIRRIYSVGAPAIVMQALTSVMTYGMNLILGGISAAAVTAYGVYYKLQNFIFMPAFGLNNASVPIISYNYGAKSRIRIRSAIRSGLIFVSVIMLAGILLLQCLAQPIVGCFAVSEESAQFCVTALHIITLGFLFAGANIILQGVCQALGNGLYSLVISLLRMIVVPLPLAALLSGLPEAGTVVWWAFPAAEATACVAAVILTIHIYRKRAAALDD
ncbi:MAG: MATE family efflux transporter [Candidatus Onthomonas sp.]